MYQGLKYMHISVDSLLNAFIFISRLSYIRSSLILVFLQNKFVERGLLKVYCIHLWESCLKISGRQFMVT